MIQVKVSKDSYDFIKTLSKKYNVSISSFCQDCIVQSILIHDRNAHDVKYSGSSPDVYYKKLASFIRETYNENYKRGY